MRFVHQLESGYFVKRVDVQRADVTAFSRLDERMDDEVVSVAVFLLVRLGGVEHGVVFRPDRIVRIELRTRTANGRDDDDR